jgi:protein SCO1
VLLTLRTAMLAAFLAILAAPASAVAGAPHLIDQNGRAFTLASLRGEPLIVTFVSAHCTDACPLIDAQFASAAKRLAADRIHARLLTITLDPENDSPSAMRALAVRFEADPRYWILASGPTADVYSIMHALGVVSVRGTKGYRDQHTTFVYYFDKDGTLQSTGLASTNLGDSIVARVDPMNGAGVAR